MDHGSIFQSEFSNVLEASKIRPLRQFWVTSCHPTQQPMRMHKAAVGKAHGSWFRTAPFSKHCGNFICE